MSEPDPISSAPPANTPPEDSSWHTELCRTDHVVIALTLAVVLIATVPLLPPGVCYSDPGDLQLASAVLGVMHPPGYAGYSSIGYLVTRVPGIDPAFAVTLACLASGLVVLSVCILFQIRMGVNPWIASAITMTLVAHHRFWASLLVPEIYMPSLAFLATATYQLVKYNRLGTRRSLWIAAILFGFAMVNRPPVAIMLPFWLVAWWLSAKRWEPTWQRKTRSLGIAMAIAAAPTFYSFAYFYCRDTPDAPYNYVEQYNETMHVVPDASLGPRAKAERVIWLMGARQFTDRVGLKWRVVRGKLRWLRGELLPARPTTLTIGLIIVGAGIVVAFGRCATGGWLMLGMGLHSVVFVCAYRIHGQAADLLPLLFAIAVCGGIGVSKVCPRRCRRGRKLAAIGLMVIVAAWMVTTSPKRRGGDRGISAQSFIETVDLATLPPDSVICAGWHDAVPLWYAKEVLVNRPDIFISATEPSRWPELFEQFDPRPIYVGRMSSRIADYTFTPFRNLWRLERTPRATSRSR